jgi:hypothetical protein
MGGTFSGFSKNTDEFLPRQSFFSTKAAANRFDLRPKTVDIDLRFEADKHHVGGRVATRRDVTGQVVI